MKITLLGNRDEILAKADHLGLTINEEEITRITSYNVCYTKLLRDRSEITDFSRTGKKQIHDSQRHHRSA